MLQTEQILQGRYQLQQQLGHNAGRQTWLATDIGTADAETVIVKLLAFSPEMQWDEFKLFEREANVLKQLDHPRIPRYRDYFSLDKYEGEGLCWFGLVQDRIPGESLQQLLDSGRRFREAQLKAIATQVLEILSYLHQFKPPVIHRDIKPSNIILGEGDRVYLVDFGAVQDTAAAAGATFTIVGTTGYAPLEQFWGKAVPASDLYGLGATLIHLLTGISPADLPQNNLRIQFRDKVSIDANFISWIEALTEPDIELRLSSATQALDALQMGRAIDAPVQTIYPPFRSRLKIQKSPSELVIKAPGRPVLFLVYKSLRIGLFSFLVILLAFLIFCWYIPLGIIYDLYFYMDFSIFLSILIAVALWIILPFIFWKTIVWVLKSPKLLFAIPKTLTIFFDADKVVIERNIGKKLYFRYQHSLNDIKSIQVGLNNQITFKQRNNETFAVDNKFTFTEGEWIVEAVKDWLKEK